MFRILFVLILFSELTISLSQEPIPEESSKWYYTLGYTNYTEGLDYNADRIPQFSGSEYQYTMVDSTLFGNGLSFGLVYENTRLRIPMSIGIMVFRQNMRGIERSLFYNEFLTQRRVRYVESGFFGEISAGLSYAVIEKKKFSLMPSVRVNPEIRLGSIVKDSISTVFETDFYYDESSLNTVSLNKLQYEGLERFIRTLNPSIGMAVKFRLSSQIYTYIETGYQWQQFSRLEFGPYSKRTSSIFGRLELCFVLD